MNSFRPGMATMNTTYSSPTHQPAPSGNVQYNTGSASTATLKSWADSQQYLDVYQVNAFYMGTAQRSQYFMSLWKTATCFGLQFIGILLLAGDQWEAYKTETGGTICSGTNTESRFVRWVAFFFATYITIFCTEQIRTLNRYGMYGWGEGQPDFVNPLWVGIGLWVNLFSLVLSWIVSCIIIYLSEDLLNMVLNAVAVTFMLTLDDEIIGSSDYNRIVSWQDSGGRSICGAIDAFYAKVGGLLLKIHPCWQRRIQFKGYTLECCDIILCPGMVVIPFIVLMCYPYGDSICLYEDAACFTSAGI